MHRRARRRLRAAARRPRARRRGARARRAAARCGAGSRPACPTSASWPAASAAQGVLGELRGDGVAKALLELHRHAGRARHRRAHAGGDRAVDPRPDRRGRAARAVDADDRGRPDLRHDRRRDAGHALGRSTTARPSTSAARAARPSSSCRHAAATDPFVAGLVLGAGGSSASGRPSSCSRTATGRCSATSSASPARARSTSSSWRSAAPPTRFARGVDLAGAEVVVNDAYGAGCSSSIAAALGVVDARCDVLVLMLGDQPGVTAETVAALLAGRGDAPLAVCRYDDGRGHPIAFDRSVFGALADLHGDKGVWRLLDQRGDDVGRGAGRRARSRSTSTRRRTTQATWPRMSRDRGGGGELGSSRRRDAGPAARRASTTSSTRAWRRRCSSRLRLPQPLLLEGEAGVGKTEAAQGAGRRARHAADPPAVLRGDRRGGGALRVELPPPAAEHPARRGRRRDAAARRTCSAPTT